MMYLYNVRCGKYCEEDDTVETILCSIEEIPTHIEKILKSETFHSLTDCFHIVPKGVNEP